MHEKARDLLVSGFVVFDKWELIFAAFFVNITLFCRFSEI